MHISAIYMDLTYLIVVILQKNIWRIWKKEWQCYLWSPGRPNLRVAAFFAHWLPPGVFPHHFEPQKLNLSWQLLSSAQWMAERLLLLLSKRPNRCQTIVSMNFPSTHLTQFETAVSHSIKLFSISSTASSSAYRFRHFLSFFFGLSWLAFESLPPEAAAKVKAFLTSTKFFKKKLKLFLSRFAKAKGWRR